MKTAGRENVLFPHRYMPNRSMPHRYMVETRAAALTLALIAIVSLAACHGGQKEAMTEPAAIPTAKVQDEASKQVPADLYVGMPIYPGAVVQHVRKPKGAMREVVFELKNSPPLDDM